MPRGSFDRATPSRSTARSASADGAMESRSFELGGLNTLSAGPPARSGQQNQERNRWCQHRQLRSSTSHRAHAHRARPYSPPSRRMHRLPPAGRAARPFMVETADRHRTPSQTTQDITQASARNDGHNCVSPVWPADTIPPHENTATWTADRHSHLITLSIHPQSGCVPGRLVADADPPGKEKTYAKKNCGIRASDAPY
jgi:hypothetical protein